MLPNINVDLKERGKKRIQRAIETLLLETVSNSSKLERYQEVNVLVKLISYLETKDELQDTPFVC